MIKRLTQSDLSFVSVVSAASWSLANYKHPLSISKQFPVCFWTSYSKGICSSSIVESIQFKRYESIPKTLLKPSDFNFKLSFTMLEPVVQSTNDSRKYRVIDLENGLRALLISDMPAKNATQATSDALVANGIANASGSEDFDNELGSQSDDSEIDDRSGDGGSESDDRASSGDDGRAGNQIGRNANINKLSAAALCIGVGSFSDPPDIPGLAHFLEHMVFMGSEKHPNENNFDSYLGKHGGSSDACTNCEETVFYFDVVQKYFEGALDRFAQFFIHPLMKKDAVDRETEAVDSEFEIGLPKDSNKVEQLLGNLAKPSHPMSKFMWGNAETLRTRPKKAGIDIYEHLKEFWKVHYVAQNMTLVVQSRDSLDRLEKWVRDIFSAIPSTTTPKPSFTHLNPPYEMATFNKLYKVISVKTIHKVILTWALPSELPHYRVKPLFYLGWLLGHEGKGSIDSFLKKRLWAFDLEAGVDDSGFTSNSCTALFQIQVTLSEEGFGKLVEVITAIFEYISMLQQAGPQKQIFDEIKTVEDNNFRWIEQTEPQDYVQDLAIDMQLCAVKDYLTGGSLLMEYDEKLIKDYTDALTPESVNIIVLSDSFKDQEICNQECPWFKTRYCVEDIPSDWMENWKAPNINAEFHLPLPNIYIATDFTIKDSDTDDSEFPVLISESPVTKVWYKKDKKFKVPRAYIYIYLTCDSINRSPKNICMTDLLVTLLENSLTEVAYDAEEADLSYSVRGLLSGIAIKFCGFNEKMLQLFQVVFDHFFGLTFTDKQFETTKDEWKKIYHNDSIKPAGLNKDLRLSLLVHNHWTLAEKLATLSSISHQDVMEFLKEILSTVVAKMLVQGNYTVMETKNLENYLQQKLKDENRPATDAPQSEFLVTELPENAVYYRAKNLNENDDNCVITNYYQHGPASIRENQLMDLLLMHMDEPCFDTLRTNQQLGYIVYCSSRLTHGIVGYSITIGSQSIKFSMKRLDEEIETFLRQFYAKVDRMTTEKFKRLVNSLVTLKRCEDTNMQEEVSRNWHEIIEGTYLFNRYQREIEELERLTLSEFKTWSSSHLLPGPKRRKFCMQVIGNCTVKDPKKTSSAPSVVKRTSGSTDSKKRKQGLGTVGCSKKKSLLKVKNEGASKMKANDDDRSNNFIKDIATFKATCKKYPFSVIM